MKVVEGFPQKGGVRGRAVDQFECRFVKVGRQRFDQLLHGMELVKELRPVGKQHLAQQTVHPGDALAPPATEVRWVERSSVRKRTVVASVPFERPHGAGQRRRESQRQFSAAAGLLACLPQRTFLPQRDGFIQGHAEHGVSSFQFAARPAEDLVLGLAQPRTPITRN